MGHDLPLFEIESGLTSFTRVDKERNKGEGRERETEKKEKIETAREGWARTKSCEGARAKYSLVARESPSHAHT